MSKKKPIHDFVVYQGATWGRKITWEIDGTAVDITGWTANMTIKKLASQATPDLELTVGSGIVLTTPASGIFNVNLTDDQTAALSGSYVYDLHLIDDTDQTYRILQGRIQVSDEV